MKHNGGPLPRVRTFTPTRCPRHHKTVPPSYKPRKRPEVATRGNKRGPTIQGQFAPRLIAMLESPAFRVLNRSEHLTMARLEIEIANHGGADNGHLPLTKQQLVEYGVHPRYVAPSLRTLEALGFIFCTERGRGGPCAEFRSPSKFRITFRHSAKVNPSDEWAQIQTLEQAEAIAKEARSVISKQHSMLAKRAYQARQKTESQVPKVHPALGAQSAPMGGKSLGAQSGPTVSGAQSGPTSISRQGMARVAMTEWHGRGIRPYALSTDHRAMQQFGGDTGRRFGGSVKPQATAAF
jgi:hypothetical protein